MSFLAKNIPLKYQYNEEIANIRKDRAQEPHPDARAEAADGGKCAVSTETNFGETRRIITGITADALQQQMPGVFIRAMDHDSAETVLLHVAGIERAGGHCEIRMGTREEGVVTIHQSLPDLLGRLGDG